MQCYNQNQFKAVRLQFYFRPPYKGQQTSDVWLYLCPCNNYTNFFLKSKYFKKTLQTDEKIDIFSLIIGGKLWITGCFGGFFIRKNSTYQKYFLCQIQKNQTISPDKFPAKK